MSKLILLLAGCTLLAADYPSAEISNGILRARLHLPDPVKGSYQGTRFDWSGIIYSLQFKNHEYFGKWYEKHDPKIHDAITGPVEEFLSGDTLPGYAEAEPGGTFLRIGVGVLRKPQENAFQRFHTYAIVDPGIWKVKTGASSIRFTHVLKSPDGYAYVYRKRLSLVKGQPRMLLEHSLKNTGSKVIDTAQYNHNFFVIDDEVVGPDVAVKFPFDLKPDRELSSEASVRGRELAYSRELRRGESVMAQMGGFGGTSSDYDFRIENRKSGAGVRITGDQPLSKVVFWSIRSVACPEPYIQLRVEPGNEKHWRIEYEFYTLGTK